MKLHKNNKGITLIALIITIIVLLILAGITLNTIAGEDGILSNAKKARERSEEAQKSEEAQLELGSAFINKWTNETEYKNFLKEMAESGITILGLEKVIYNMETGSQEEIAIIKYKEAYYSTNYTIPLFDGTETEEEIENISLSITDEMLTNMKTTSKSELTDAHKLLYEMFYEEKYFEYLESGKDISDDYSYRVVIIYNNKNFMYQEDTSDEINVISTVHEMETPELVSISNGCNAVFGLDAKGHVWNLESLPVNINREYNIENVVFTKISSGDENVLMLDSNGKMWGYGYNYDGELGSTQIDEILTEPVCINDISTNPLNGIIITDISLSSTRSYGLVLDNTGKVYYFGWGSEEYFGEYGAMEPICLNTLQNSTLNGVTITKISAGAYNGALFLDNEGKVWSFLADGYSIAGTANCYDNYLPICLNEVEGNPLSDVVITDISVGNSNAMAIDSQGRIWSWGYDYGHNEDVMDNRFATEVSFRNNNYKVEKLSSPDYYEANIPVCLSEQENNPLYGVKGKEISVRYEHSLILDTQGKLWAFGNNWDGQLFENENIVSAEETTLPICVSDNEECEFYNKEIISISAGAGSTGIIDENHQVYLYGDWVNFSTK